MDKVEYYLTTPFQLNHPIGGMVGDVYRDDRKCQNGE